MLSSFERLIGLFCVIAILPVQKTVDGRMLFVAIIDGHSVRLLDDSFMIDSIRFDSILHSFIQNEL